MASLNHVCMWSESGWKRVTAEEAAELHPGGTVSAHSGLFMCDLCGQYVTLTDGFYRDRYFKHSSYEYNKDCPERSKNSSYYPTYEPKRYELPIRLVNVSESYFSLEIGLLKVPQQLLDMAEDKRIEIISNDESYIYNFERLEVDRITYLSVGNTPSKEYIINSDKKLRDYWPRKVRGIQDYGCIFEFNSGKKLVADANVLLNTSYMLLTELSEYCIDFLCNIKGIQYKKLSFYGMWNIYEIKATSFTEDAAKFFLKFHCRLTDSPVLFQPIWPLYVETPHLIKYNSNYMFIHTGGKKDLSIKSFPYTYTDRVRVQNDSFLYKVNISDRQQLIATGMTNVQKYAYFWNEKLNQKTEKQNIDVSDDKNNILASGVYDKLPVNETIKVISACDGYILIKRNNIVIRKITIKAEEKCLINSICFGTHIEVYQGLDFVWSIEFIRSPNVIIGEDNILVDKLKTLNKGKFISVDYKFNMFILALNELKLTKAYLYETKRKGKVSQQMYRYLNKYVIERKLKRGQI